MKKATGYLLISLHALIILFFVFREQLAFPPLVQSFGRVHPLFLHIPIGVLMLTAVLTFLRRADKTTGLISFLLAFTSVTAALTALMGIVLGAEGGYDAEALNAHRIAGVITSFVAWTTYFVYNSFPGMVTLHKILLATCVIVLLIAGHLGSVMTHGDQYVLAPIFSGNEDRETISDSTSLFRAAVFPVLEEKCLGCHNNKKQKGGLSFSSGASMMKGGEHGKPWQAGEPNRSLVLTRVLLPEGHKDHMPPEGKPQLNVVEVNLLYHWIQGGADTALAWTAYGKQDTVRRLAEALMAQNESKDKQVYTFDEADAETVEQLNDAYRTVSRVALSEPALSASMFIREQYTTDRLKDLQKVNQQLVDLNLSGMPVSDDDCSIISEFRNLERLNLNFSAITGGCIESLSGLEKLRSLAVAGTKLKDDALVKLKEFPALKEVFIWNTEVSDIAMLRSELDGITIQTGAVVDEKEVLRLSPPLLVNESYILSEGDSIRLSHKLPGIVMRFTTDGTEPDSVLSPVFNNALGVSTSTELKVLACKPGWHCSKAARFLFFIKGATPAGVSLNTPPDKDYRGQGALTLHDNKKGFADNTRGDIAWLGYRENSLDATFSFDSTTVVNEIVVSYAKNIYGFLFPPASAEIWAGDDKAKLRLIRELSPPKPTKLEPTAMEALHIPLDHAHFSFYRIILRPVPQLPAWHPQNKKETKDKRGWVFVDEIFFN